MRFCQLILFDSRRVVGYADVFFLLFSLSLLFSFSFFEHKLVARGLWLDDFCTPKTIGLRSSYMWTKACLTWFRIQLVWPRRKLVAFHYRNLLQVFNENKSVSECWADMEISIETNEVEENGNQFRSTNLYKQHERRKRNGCVKNAGDA